MKEVSSSKTAGKAVQGIMVCGPGGVGKTTQFGTLEGKKFMYCFDPHSAEQLIGDVDYVEFIPPPEEIAVGARTLKDPSKQAAIDVNIGYAPGGPKTYEEFRQDFHDRLQAGFFEAYDWVGFDSTTTWSEMMLDRIMYLAGRPGKHPEQPDWAAEMNLMRSNIRTIAKFSHVYLCTHIEPHKDELTKRISYDLVLTGKNRLRIPLRFSNVVLLDTSDGEKYEMKIKKEMMYPYIRSTLPKRGFESPLDVTIDFKRPPVGQGLGKYFKLETTKEKESV